MPESADREFLHYIVGPEIAAQITNFTCYGGLVEAANQFIISDILEEPAIYPSRDVKTGLEWIQDVGVATQLSK